MPDNWQGGVPDIGEWWTGDASSPIVHLMNLQDEVERQPIRNVIGRIMGYESPEKIVYAGNHRDAWCFGAVDPGSGTAVMLEVVRVFGELVRRGWRPRRTIVFASWDAEEYNLIGSTEHVEEGIDVLRQHAVAYLNVDSAVSGKQFRASGNPVFEKALTDTLGRVMMPEGNETALAHWTKAGSKLEGLGAGSDYVAFQGEIIHSGVGNPDQPRQILQAQPPSILPLPAPKQAIPTTPAKNPSPGSNPSSIHPTTTKPPWPRYGPC